MRDRQALAHRRHTIFGITAPCHQRTDTRTDLQTRLRHRLRIPLVNDACHFQARECRTLRVGPGNFRCAAKHPGG